MANSSGKPRIAVLASGRGSNLQALIDAVAGDRLQVCLVGVFSDRAGAQALARASDAAIAAHALDPRAYASREAFDRTLFERVAASNPDFVVCAGYMRLLSDDVVEAWRGRLLNIHPSLLPSFKGLHTHQRALDAGVDTHGASVHFVTPDLDGGPVITQVRVPVLPGDDADTLGARVLAREHQLLVQSIDLLAGGRVRLQDDIVQLDGKPLPTPLQLTANNALA